MARAHTTEIGVCALAISGTLARNRQLAAMDYFVISSYMRLHSGQIG